MHEKVKQGMELSVSVPANNFPAAAHATKHLLIAGGIGVTPLFAQRLELRAQRRALRAALHVPERRASRVRRDARARERPHIHLYDNARGQRLDVGALLRCAARGDTRLRVWARGSHERGHRRRARAGVAARERPLRALRRAEARRAMQPFEVVCRAVGQDLTVTGDETLLEALEKDGLTIPFACRAGSCGACELAVLEGEIEHRDSVLTEAEKARRQEDAVLRVAREDPSRAGCVGRPGYGAESGSVELCACYERQRLLVVTQRRRARASRARGEVLPETLQALVASEQRAEHRRIDHQHVAGTVAARRHPDERVELLVSGVREGMRPGEVDGLLAENVDGPRVVRRHRVVRKVQVKIEVLTPLSQPRVSRSLATLKGAIRSPIRAGRRPHWLSMGIPSPFMRDRV